MIATIHHFTDRGREEHRERVVNTMDAINLAIALLESEDAPSSAHIVFSLDQEPISVFTVGKVTP